MNLNLARIFLLAFALWWASCSQPSPVAGGGGVVGNPPIAGIVLDAHGRAVANARVTLYRQGYSPVSGDTAAGAATSDSSGRYLLDAVPAGTYNIVATVIEGRFLGMTAGVVAPPGASRQDTVQAESCFLAKPASVSIPLAGLAAAEGGFLYLPGTPVAGQIDSTSLRRGVLTLENVPAGTFPALDYVKDKAAAPRNILSEPLVIKAGANIVAGSYQSWKQTRKVTLNTSASGAGIGEAVIRFPLLVRLDTGNFDFTAAGDSGQDLRFTKSDGATSLPYQIERWDRTGGRAEIWVRLDTVRADDDSQFIYLFAGRDSLASQSQGKSVFDTADGFTAVWHLGDAVTGAQPVYRDAAGWGNHGTGVGLAPGSQAEGVIGRAVALDGKTQYILVPDADNLRLRTFTFSAWIKPDSLGGRVFDKITAGGYDGYSFDTHGGRIRVCGSPDNYGGLTPLAPGRFIHIAATFDGRTTRFFLNGNPDGVTDSLAAIPPNVFDLRIGSAKDGTQKFQGLIDEARISHVPNSASWIKLSFENQKPGSTVVLLK